jgi:hypothetical protein
MSGVGTLERRIGSSCRVQSRAWGARMPAMSWIIRCNSICDRQVRHPACHALSSGEEARRVLAPALSYSSLMAWSGITHLSVMRSPSASPNGMLEEVLRPWEYLLRGASASDRSVSSANHGRNNTRFDWGISSPGNGVTGIWF